MLDRRLYVKKFYNEFRENPTELSITYTAQQEGRKTVGKMGVVSTQGVLSTSEGKPKIWGGDVNFYKC
jgi:hypothetical protein